MRVLVTCLAVLGAMVAAAEDSTSGQTASNRFHFDFPTMGGLQFWSDELVQGEWRIQHNLVTDDYRLLDANNLRRASGTFDACRAEVHRAQLASEIPEMKGKVILTLHGLVATRRCMEPLGTYLRDHEDCTVINIGYASTRGDLKAHAAGLAKVISNLSEVKEISVVAHSMGNLVFRQYLSDEIAAGHEADIRRRFQRVVMLGPPNQGAQLAEKLREISILESVFGQSAKQLAFEGRTALQQLAIPPCEFGIIAGGQGDESGRNPILSGDDDLIVRVEETRLAGASDFLIVPQKHRAMLRDPQVHEYVLRFLQHGYFTASDARHPIPKD